MIVFDTESDDLLEGATKLHIITLIDRFTGERARYHDQPEVDTTDHRCSLRDGIERLSAEVANGGMDLLPVLALGLEPRRERRAQLVLQPGRLGLQLEGQALSLLLVVVEAVLFLEDSAGRVVAQKWRDKDKNIVRGASKLPPSELSTRGRRRAEQVPDGRRLARLLPQRPR